MAKAWRPPQSRFCTESKVRPRHPHDSMPQVVRLPKHGYIPFQQLLIDMHLPPHLPRVPSLRSTSRPTSSVKRQIIVSPRSSFNAKTSPAPRHSRRGEAGWQRNHYVRRWQGARYSAAPREAGFVHAQQGCRGAPRYCCSDADARCFEGDIVLA